MGENNRKPDSNRFFVDPEPDFEQKLISKNGLETVGFRK